MSSQPLMGNEPTWRAQQDEIAGNGTRSQRYRLCDDHPALVKLCQMPILTILQLFIQILLSILLIANLLMIAFMPQVQEARAGNPNEEPNSAAVIFNFTSKVLHTKYGSDVSYMSLDTQFDWLWSSESDKYAGLIALDPSNADGSTRWGAITM